MKSSTAGFSGRQNNKEPAENTQVRLSTSHVSDDTSQLEEEHVG